MTETRDTPSVPVESREQPREERWRRASGFSVPSTRQVECMALADEEQVRLRAEIELLSEEMAGLERGFVAQQNHGRKHWLEAQAALAERDRARDLAAHLEEDTGKRRATR